MNDNTKNLAKMQLHNDASVPTTPLSKTSTIAQLLHLKSSQSADYSHSTNMSPTTSNLLTANFPLSGDSNRQVSENSFKSRNTRRNSTLIDRQTHHKQRRSSKTDNNTSLTSSGGSNLLQQKNSSVERDRQKTFDSLNESLSNLDCKINFFLLCLLILI